VVVGLGAGAAGDLLEVGIGLGFDARALFVAAASGQGAKIPSRKSSGTAMRTVPEREAKSAAGVSAAVASDTPLHATNKITAATALPVATIASVPVRTILAVIGVLPPCALAHIQVPPLIDDGGMRLRRKDVECPRAGIACARQRLDVPGGGSAVR
jgi:hypothetical protein